MAVKKNLNVTINFSKNNIFHLSYWMKKLLLKQDVATICTLEKNFYVALVLFKVSESFLFRESEKPCTFLCSVLVFFGFQEKKRPNRYYLWEIKLFSYCTWLVWYTKKCEFIIKNSASKRGLCFRLFLWRTQNNFPL